jgi:arabinogalactan oligomer/maltooligosaccharide transport system permease protein
MSGLTGKIIAQSLGQVGSTLASLILVIVVVEVLLYLILAKALKYRYTLPFMLIAPAAIGLALLVIYPIGYEIRLAFSNMSLRSFKNPEFGPDQAWRNFRMIFTQPVLKQAMFFPVFLRTILWTVIQVTSHVVLGMCLALLLHRPMKLRGLYQALIIVPWAIPQVIAVLTWRNEFHFEYGFINIMLTRIGLNAVNWKTNPFWNFAAINLTNIWLGVPFMMVIILGGLQSISKSYYEAAEIDGASGWKRFRSVTFPLLQPVLTPAIILGTIWTFNLFNVPFLINQYELETSDILVTALFRAAFEYNRYGFAAAFALVIFVILFVFSVLYIKLTGGLKGVYER